MGFDGSVDKSVCGDEGCLHLLRLTQVFFLVGNAAASGADKSRLIHQQDIRGHVLLQLSFQCTKCFAHRNL